MPTIHIPIHLPTLRAIVRCVPSKSSKPIMEAVGFHLDANHVRYVGGVCNWTISKRIPAVLNNIPEGVRKFSVDGKELERLPKGDETIMGVLTQEHDDDGRSSWTLTLAGVVMRCICYDMHPAFSSADLHNDSADWSIWGAIETDDYLAVSAACDADRGQPVLSGVLLGHLENGDGCIAATDGKILLESRAKRSTDAPDIVLPADIAYLIKRASLDGKTARVMYSRANRASGAPFDSDSPVRLVAMLVDGFQLTVRNIEGTFPRYHHALDTTDGARIHLPMALAGLAKAFKSPANKRSVVLTSLRVENMDHTWAMRVGNLEANGAICSNADYISTCVAFAGEGATWAQTRGIIGVSEDHTRRSLFMPIALPDTWKPGDASQTDLPLLGEPAKRKAKVAPASADHWYEEKRIMQATIDTLNEKLAYVLACNKSLQSQLAAIRSQEAVAV